jgi:hypothetical protein
MLLGQSVSPDRYAALVEQAQALEQPWLQFDPNVLRASYNRRPFLLSHRLAEHPSFSFSMLAGLCRRLPPDQVKYRFGVIPDNAEFDKSLDRFRGDLSLDDALDRMVEKQAYVAIYNPEYDAAYRPVIEGLLGEIAAQAHEVDPHINWYSTYIFVSANDSVTPYHMDREMNFLLQIRGTKTVRLWDPSDDEIMDSSQRDLLLSNPQLPRPEYRPSFEAKAMVFELAPGLGVHHPFIAPHLVHTGPELSVSLAVTFRTRKSDVWTDAHRLNHRLRRLGLRPGPVGQSPVTDHAKAAVFRSLRRTRQWLRRAPGAQPANASA